jgi:hypothetical protein
VDEERKRMRKRMVGQTLTLTLLNSDSDGDASAGVAGDRNGNLIPSKQAGSRRMS